jgi:hypothetical protein
MTSKGCVKLSIPSAKWPVILVSTDGLMAAATASLGRISSAVGAYVSAHFPASSAFKN